MGIFSKKEQTNVAPITSAQLSVKPGHADVTFPVPWSAIEAKLPAAATKLSGQKPLPGFRAGHVPVGVARQHYGDQLLMAEAYDLVVPSLYANAIMEAGHETIGQPAMEFEPQPTWGADVAVTATAPVLPSVTLPDWSAIKVARITKEVTDAEVQKTINSLRERLATEAAVNRPTATGDLVELDYEVLVDNVAVEGGSGIGHKAIVGRGQLLPEIETILVGMKAGEERRQTITFEPEHSLKVVAGKTADCRILLKQVFERTLPEVDDSFVAGLGPFKTVTELTDRVRADLEEGAKDETNQQTERACLEAAVAGAKFGVLPEILINDEVSRLMHELEHNVERYGIKFDDYLLHLKKNIQELRLDFVMPATQRLKVILLLRAISREQKFTVSDEAVATEITRIKATVRPEDQDRFSDPRIQAQVRADLVQKAAVDWVVAKVVIA